LLPLLRRCKIIRVGRYRVFGLGATGVAVRILVHGINFAPELIGVGKFTGEMCEWLARRGHAFKIISSYPHYPDWKITEAGGHRSYSFDSISGLSVVRCPIYVPRHPTGSRRLLHHVSFLASSGPVLVPVARRFRPDVVLAIAPSLIGAPAAALAARMCGEAAWLHIQDFETDAAFELGLLSGARRRQFARNLEAWIMRRFDRLSSISLKMVERLEHRVGPPHQAVEFRNWVDVDLVAPRDRRTASLCFDPAPARTKTMLRARTDKCRAASTTYSNPCFTAMLPA
jgi:colanic acid biosynthesis glycosyl transferase WcaI